MAHPHPNPIRVVSNLTDVANALQQLNINTTAQFGEVQFQLDEHASLQDAANMKMKIRPGREGFKLVNPELLECKYCAKVELETAFNLMLDTSIQQIDQELEPIEDSIAALRVLVRRTDEQMQHNGPPLEQRNRGVVHCLYPCPPFPVAPEFEIAGGHATHRVPYQQPYGTQQERDHAAARDRLAQRAVWQTKLRIMEARKSILKQNKFEMMARMRAELKMMMEERSDLGIGYAEYKFPPLA